MQPLLGPNKVSTSRLSLKHALFCLVVVGMFLQWALYYLKTDTLDRFGRRGRKPGEVCLPSVLASDEQYLNYFNTTNTNDICNKWRTFGSKDGPGHQQLVCMDPEYEIHPNKCLVFSHGVTNWGFEDEFDLMGCRVFALDPLLPQEKQRLGPNTNFLDIGLATFDGRHMAQVEGKQVFFEVTRFENLIQDLKLDAFFVDYLKLDVPGFAEEFLQDVLLTSPRIISQVKQFSVTVNHTSIPYHHEAQRSSVPGIDGGQDVKEDGHGVNPHYATMWTYLQLLECLGFSLLHSMPVGPHAHRVVWGRVPTPEDRKELEKWSRSYDYV